MNKDQALQRIAAIEKEAAELRELVNKPDVPTYKDVVEKIKPMLCLGVGGNIIRSNSYYSCCYDSEQTARREALRAKWLNIAEYINDGWTPDWSNEDEIKFNHCYNNHYKEIKIYCYSIAKTSGAVYFKSKEAASLALQIMGEDDWKRMNGIE